MAKKKPQPTSDVNVIPVIVVERGPNAVLLVAGHDAGGAYLTSEGVADDPYTLRDHEIHVAGQPYVHVADTADGVWIYAPRLVSAR